MSLDPASQIIYQKFTRVLFPDVHSLIEDKIFPPERLSELLRDVYDVTDQDAVQYTLNKISAIAAASSEKKIQIAIAPAGGVLTDVLDALNFDLVEIVGIFDSHPEGKEAGQIPLFSYEKLKEIEFEYLIVISRAYAREIVKKASEFMDFWEERIYCPYWDIEPAERETRTPVMDIQKICTENLGAEYPVVVFVCIRFYAHFYKRMVALKEKGVKVVLLCLVDDVSNSLDLAEMEDIFEYVYCSEYHLVNLLYVLQKITPEVFHILSLVNNSQIPTLMSTVLKRPYVVEFNDLLTTMYDQQGLAVAVGADESHVEFTSERSLVDKCAGVIHKNHVSAFREMLEIHDTVKPGLQFFPYPLGTSPSTTEPLGKRIKIVAIGGIHKTVGACNLTAATVLDLIDMITAQGFSFDIYNAYDSGREEGYEEFWALEEKNPYFNYHIAIHPMKLTEKLRAYDVGWMVDDYKNSPFKIRYLETSMSARVFDYLEAGLPIIAFDKITFMAQFIKENRVGIIIPYDQTENLAQWVDRASVMKWKHHVNQLIPRIRMNGKISKLCRFYKKVQQRQ